MTDRLAEIAERTATLARDREKYAWTQSQDDRAWLIANTNAALAYINRMLDGHENSQKLADLRRIQNILAGTDDGLPANTQEPNDGH
jgi:hypothetical protein